MNDVRRDADIGGLRMSHLRDADLRGANLGGEEAAARRLQWEAAERMSRMQRDARRREIRQTIVWMAIGAALIFAVPSVVKFYVGCTP